MKIIAAAAAALLFCGTAHAQIGTSSMSRASDDESVAIPGGDAKNASASDTDPNKIICRREKVVGSRLQAKRICATSAQWAQMRADQRERTEQIQKDRPITGR